MTLLPKKHIRISDTTLGLGAIILQILKDNKALTLDELWALYAEMMREQERPITHHFDSLVLAVSFLYAARFVDSPDGTLIRYAPTQT